MHVAVSRMSYGTASWQLDATVTRTPSNQGLMLLTAACGGVDSMLQVPARWLQALQGQ